MQRYQQENKWVDEAQEEVMEAKEKAEDSINAEQKMFEWS